MYIIRYIYTYVYIYIPPKNVFPNAISDVETPITGIETKCKYIYILSTYTSFNIESVSVPLSRRRHPTP